MAHPRRLHSETDTVTRPRRVFALDLGTTKVCCAVADLESTGLRVLGVGMVASRGVRKGAVVEIDRAAEAVAEAVDMAEQMSGVPIDSAVVGIAGGHITSQNSRGVVAVAAGHREVRASLCSNCRSTISSFARWR